MAQTLQEHYNSIKNGKGNKAQFLKQARLLFPQYINQYSDFDTATNVLKSKQIISEAAIGGVISKGFDIWDWKKILTEEAKSVEKETSKEVLDAQKHAYNNGDMKNADNINFNEIMKGFYTELKCKDNYGKTGDELYSMVVQNLSKDPLFYTKSGEFGTKGVGYTTEAPGLGEPKEPKGKYKSSGYGDLETEVEKIKANVKDTLSGSEAKTSMPRKVKEMPVTPQNSSGVKKMPMPGKEKKIRLSEVLADEPEETNPRNNKYNSMDSRLGSKKDLTTDIMPAFVELLGAVKQSGRKGLFDKLINVVGSGGKETELISILKDHGVYDEFKQYLTPLNEANDVYSQIADLEYELMITDDPELKQEIEAKIQALEMGLQEIVYQGPLIVSPGGDGGGERKKPRVLYIGKDQIERINKLEPGSIRILSPKSAPNEYKMFISNLFYFALQQSQRGRTTLQSERQKSELAKLAEEVLSSQVRVIIKGRVESKFDPNTKLHFVNIELMSTKDGSGYWILTSQPTKEELQEIAQLREIIREIIKEELK